MRVSIVGVELDRSRVCAPARGALSEHGACGAPLDVGGSWFMLAEVLDGEGVVVAEHFQAGAALAGDGLWILSA